MTDVRLILLAMSALDRKTRGPAVVAEPDPTKAGAQVDGGLIARADAAGSTAAARSGAAELNPPHLLMTDDIEAHKRFERQLDEELESAHLRDCSDDRM